MEQLALLKAGGPGLQAVDMGGVQGHSPFPGNMLLKFAPVTELPSCISLPGAVTVVPAPAGARELPWLLPASGLVAGVGELDGEAGNESSKNGEA